MLQFYRRVLEKKNITIMLGVEESRLDEAVYFEAVCRKRKQTIYSNVTMPTGSQYAVAMPSVPVNVELGGVTVLSWIWSGWKL